MESIWGGQKCNRGCNRVIGNTFLSSGVCSEGLILSYLPSFSSLLRDFFYPTFSHHVIHVFTNLVNIKNGGN